MQAKLEQKKFVPFTIQIVVESDDEAFDLWHRLCLSHQDVVDVQERRMSVTRNDHPPLPEHTFILELFNKIDDELARRGYRRSIE